MHRSNRAFTLIELLVVIAIIAILAAILFPVFAQAKVAAKKAVAISNVKELSLGLVMYGGDYDDMFPKRATMNGNGQSWADGMCTVSQDGCPTWDKSIQPYLKNYGILASPMDRTAGVPSNHGPIVRSWRAAKNVIRGLTGIPTWGGPEYPVVVLSFTSIPAPANTIMLDQQPNDAVLIQPFWLWSTYWEEWCWGAGSANTVANTDTSLAPTDPDKYYSGIDFSFNGVAPYAFVDGHVGVFPKGYLFPGYSQQLTYNSPVNPALPGVCLDDNDFIGSTSQDCPLPQN